MAEEIISALQKIFNPEKMAAYFSETHTCLPKNVHGVTCQKTVAAAGIQRLV
jgi:hypothetical protein